MDTIYPVIFYFRCDLDNSESTYLFLLSFTSCLLFAVDTICRVIFYFLCYSDHSEFTYLFSLSFTTCCSGWTLYMQSFSISSATRIRVSLLIYFPSPLLPTILNGHYMSGNFLFPQLLGSEWVYLFIFPFLYFLLFWMGTICPVNFIFSTARITVSLLIYFPFPLLLAVLEGHYISSIFYFLCYSDYSVSTYLFPLSFPFCCSGWTLYVQKFSISTGTRIKVCLLIYFLISSTSCSSGRTIYIQSFSIYSATWITVCLLNYFPFPSLPAVLDGHYIYNYFLLPLLFGSQCVYLFISPFLSFLLSVWTLYIHSFSIFFATWITVCLLIYFCFPFLPAFLDVHYMSNHFLFPLLLESQRVNLFIFPFLSYLLFWMETIYPVIFYFHCNLDHIVSTYSFSLS